MLASKLKEAYGYSNDEAWKRLSKPNAKEVGMSLYEWLIVDKSSFLTTKTFYVR